MHCNGILYDRARNKVLLKTKERERETKMVLVNIECIIRHQADKSYLISDEDFEALTKKGIIPESVKEDILDYTPQVGEEKYNFVVRVEKETA